MKVGAFHTINPEYPPTHRNVYHDESECHYGKAIKMEDRVPGQGGKARCDRCIELGN